MPFMVHIWTFMTIKDSQTLSTDPLRSICRSSVKNPCFKWSKDYSPSRNDDKIVLKRYLTLRMSKRCRNEGLNEAHIKELDFIVILLSNPPATSSSCCGKRGHQHKMLLWWSWVRENENVCACETGIENVCGCVWETEWECVWTCV